MFEFSVWFIFGVILAMLPIAFKIITCISRGVPSLTFVWLFGAGDLLLITTVIACNALGEALFVTTSHPIVRLISSGVCLILLMLSSYWFGDISAPRSDAATNMRVVSYGSAILLGLNVIAGACCVYSVTF